MGGIYEGAGEQGIWVGVGRRALPALTGLAMRLDVIASWDLAQRLVQTETISQRAEELKGR